MIVLIKFCFFIFIFNLYVFEHILFFGIVLVLVFTESKCQTAFVVSNLSLSKWKLWLFVWCFFWIRCILRPHNILFPFSNCIFNIYTRFSIGTYSRRGNESVSFHQWINVSDLLCLAQEFLLTILNYLFHFSNHLVERLKHHLAICLYGLLVGEISFNSFTNDDGYLNRIIFLFKVLVPHVNHSLGFLTDNTWISTYWAG